MPKSKRKSRNAEQQQQQNPNQQPYLHQQHLQQQQQQWETNQTGEPYWNPNDPHQQLYDQQQSQQHHQAVQLQPEAFLDTIPEDVSVAAARVANLSTASAIASSDDGLEQVRPSQGSTLGKFDEDFDGDEVDSLASDTPAVLVGGADASERGQAGKRHKQLLKKKQQLRRQRSQNRRQRQQQMAKRATSFAAIIVVLLVVVAIGMLFIVEHVKGGDDGAIGTNQTTDPPSAVEVGSDFDDLIDPPMPSAAPTINNQGVDEVDLALSLVLDANLSSDISVLFDSSTPQGQCRYWMTRFDAVTQAILAGAEEVFTNAQSLLRLQQRFILCVLYKSTNGANWFSTIPTATETATTTTTDGAAVAIDETENFFVDDYAHECDWYGVACDAESRQVVVVVDLANNSLMGTIPGEIVHLSNLVDINLSSNRDLTGSIPPLLFTSLTNLIRLDVSGSSLTGTLPYTRDDAIASATNGSMLPLEILYVYDNLLSGTVPWFPNLEMLWANDNLFTSWDPLYAVGLSDNTNPLVKLALFRNQLEGELPTTWDAPNLQRIDLGWNDQLTGPIYPNDLWTLPHIKLVGLNSCNFTGQLPSTLISTTTDEETAAEEDIFSRVTTIEEVYLYENSLSGMIPDTLGLYWENLSKLWLHSNPNLFGSIGSVHCSYWPNLNNLTAGCSVTCSCCTIDCLDT